MDLSKYPLQVNEDISEVLKEVESLNKKGFPEEITFSLSVDKKYIFEITFTDKKNNFVFRLESFERKAVIYYKIYSQPYRQDTSEGLIISTERKNLLAFFKRWYELAIKIIHLDINIKQSLNKIPKHNVVAKSEPINRVNLLSFQFIEKIKIANLSNKKEIYILGENGDGKTFLLQAMVLAFKEHFVKNIARKSLVGEFLDFEKDFDKATYEIELDDKTVLSKTNQSYHQDVYAYGTNRGNILSETEDEYGFMTLFSPRYHLRNPVDWLVELRGKELELKAQNENKDEENNKKQNILTLEIAKSLLEDIINSSENPKDIHIEVDLSTKEKVKFIERDTKIKFEHLSEGYRSVFIWVADLVSRLAESQPTVKQIQDFKGIVLVDEINLHLHPKWEIQIVQKLRFWFPNIQFFFTTHSPICVLGASEDAVFYRLYKENGVAQLSEQIEYSQIKEMTANQIVTSMLFDLETPFMRHTESSEIDTSEDYLYNRIHKKISDRLDKRKEEGEVYFSDEEINAMIDEALDSEIDDEEIEDKNKL